MSSGKAKRISKEQLTQNDIKAFWSAAKKDGDSDCLVIRPIQGRCSSSYFKCDDGTMVNPTRLAYAIEFGECKEGFALYHNEKCCNPLCINPYHYKPVSQKRGHTQYSNDTKQNDKVDNDESEYEPLSASNVKDYIKSKHDALDKEIRDAADGCESAIEELFAIALKNAIATRELVSHPETKIEKQREFTFGGKKYRADFCIARTFEAPYAKVKMQKMVVVECDGWKYHYAEPGLVVHDHERDRAFMSHGITVIRFTGSEINKDPDECASAVVDILDNQEWIAEFAVRKCIEAYKEATDEVHD